MEWQHLKLKKQWLKDYINISIAIQDESKTVYLQTNAINMILYLQFGTAGTLYRVILHY